MRADCACADTRIRGIVYDGTDVIRITADAVIATMIVTFGDPEKMRHGGNTALKKEMLISTSSSGKLFAFVMSRRLVISATLLLLVSISFGIWGTVNSIRHEQLRLALDDRDARLQQLQARTNQQIAALNERLKAEQEKIAVYARALGEMQARMARLDALGSRLVEVASLDRSDFDFGLQPAFGGLRQQSGQRLLAQVDLRNGIDSTLKRMKQIDAQLAAVDFMLGKQHAERDAKPHSWPTIGGWISSGFGARIDPFTGAPAQHYGVDIANHFGAPILAASSGVVTFAGKMDDFGYVVDIEHGHGYKTRYAHMSSLAVNVGDVIETKHIIGRIGSTGHSTGPHLHFEVRQYGKLVNPAPFLKRRS